MMALVFIVLSQLTSFVSFELVILGKNRSGLIFLSLHWHISSFPRHFSTIPLSAIKSYFQLYIVNQITIQVSCRLFVKSSFPSSGHLQDRIFLSLLTVLLVKTIQKR